MCFSKFERFLLKNYDVNERFLILEGRRKYNKILNEKDTEGAIFEKEPMVISRRMCINGKIKYKKTAEIWKGIGKLNIIGFLRKYRDIGTDIEYGFPVIKE